jgi:molybdopterin-biosynthesis enzyme MoeA-like protein
MLADDSFGLIVIGDEILAGKRRDRHFKAFRELLGRRGYALSWVQILPDDPDLLIDRFKASMSEGRPVFSCGGIGATPDDHTRQCAAEAAGVPLQRHPGAVAELEARFGEEAYPTRIKMADLPAGAELVPNPYNRIPGFVIHRHYFVPGFPDMAHPMAEWVLDHWYDANVAPLYEQSVMVRGVAESLVVDLMERLVSRYPEHKLFSLPKLGDPPVVELGFRSRTDLTAAMGALCDGLNELDFEFDVVNRK